jgi:hypothetical protein
MTALDDLKALKIAVQPHVACGSCSAIDESDMHVFDADFDDIIARLERERALLHQLVFDAVDGHAEIGNGNTAEEWVENVYDDLCEFATFTMPETWGHLVRKP